MNSIYLVLILFSINCFIQVDNIPNLKMKIGNDKIGSHEEETCFGCGDCSVYCAIGNEFSFSSSSELSYQEDINYSIENIDDYNLKTAWIEGVEGYGIGEWFELKFDKMDFSTSDLEIDGLYLFNGYRKSETIWKNNSRIKKLKVKINDDDFVILELADSYSIQSVKWNSLKLKNIKTMRFEILEIYKGEKFKDTAISELKLQGNHHH